MTYKQIGEADYDEEKLRINHSGLGEMFDSTTEHVLTQATESDNCSSLAEMVTE